MLRCPRLIEKLSRARVAAQKPQILSKQAREGELGVAAQKPQNVKTLINSPTQSDASRLKDTSYILQLNRSYSGHKLPMLVRKHFGDVEPLRRMITVALSCRVFLLRKHSSIYSIYTSSPGALLFSYSSYTFLLHYLFIF